MTRTDWKPSATNRARLAGRSAQETPNYRLAAEVRKLNAQIERLSPDQQRDLQTKWLTDWAQLREQLASAKGDPELRFEHIEAWSRHWLDRLG
jgi:hypothetical protein